jgi:hypothetical protein
MIRQSHVSKGQAHLRFIETASPIHFNELVREYSNSFGGVVLDLSAIIPILELHSSF